jgi:hypothetical protein
MSRDVKLCARTPSVPRALYCRSSCTREVFTHSACPSATADPSLQPRIGAPRARDSSYREKSIKRAGQSPHLMEFQDRSSLRRRQLGRTSSVASASPPVTKPGTRTFFASMALGAARAGK